MHLLIDHQGSIRCLYSEAIPLATLGELQIARASQVEPEADGWYAELARCGGPKLGPFGLRSEALQAEVVWIEQHLLPAVIEASSAGNVLSAS